MIKMDMKGATALENKLRWLNKDGLPYANRAALNNMAFRSQDIARGKVFTKMRIKNGYTLRSIQVQKAHGLNIDSQYSIMGSIQPYMETQEFGGIKKPGPNAENVDLPTAESAGQIGSKKRTKLPTSRNTLRKIVLRKNKYRHKTQAQLNMIKVKMAAKEGHKTLFLEKTKKGKDGIYRIMGTKNKFKVRLMHDLNLKSAVIPKNPWLYPTIEAIKPLAPRIYMKALAYQLRRIK